MSRVKNIIGKTFGRLYVIKYVFSNKNKKRIYLCQCSCGKRKNVIGANLLKGSSKSCGCLFIELLIKRRYKHGLSKTTEHNIWTLMKARCNTKKGIPFKNYGKRGIKVCSKWKNSFEHFYKDMGPRPSKLYSLDRIDNNKGYFKENCRWATRKEQNNNTRSNIIITYKGISKSISNWAHYLGVNRETIASRIRYGFPIESILNPNTIPHGKGKCK